LSVFGWRGIIAGAGASDAGGSVCGDCTLPADGVLRITDALHALDPRARNPRRGFFLVTARPLGPPNTVARNIRRPEGGDRIGNHRVPRLNRNAQCLFVEYSRTQESRRRRPTRAGL